MTPSRRIHLGSIVLGFLLCAGAFYLLPKVLAESSAPGLQSPPASGAYTAIPILREKGDASKTECVMVISAQGHVWYVDTSKENRLEELTVIGEGDLRRGLVKR